MLTELLNDMILVYLSSRLLRGRTNQLFRLMNYFFETADCLLFTSVDARELSEVAVVVLTSID